MFVMGLMWIITARFFFRLINLVIVLYLLFFIRGGPGLFLVFFIPYVPVLSWLLLWLETLDKLVTKSCFCFSRIYMRFLAVIYIVRQWELIFISLFRFCLISIQHGFRSWFILGDIDSTLVWILTIYKYKY